MAGDSHVSTRLSLRRDLFLGDDALPLLYQTPPLLKVDFI